MSGHSKCLRVRHRSNGLRARRRLRLTHVLEEPDFVAIRIEHLEGPVPPPLGRQPFGDLHALLLQLSVVRLDVADLAVDLDRLFLSARAYRRTRALSADSTVKIGTISFSADCLLISGSPFGRRVFRSPAQCHGVATRFNYSW